VRDGQTSPHGPRLVVSRITCPPPSPAPHANSFIIGTAVINTHTRFIMGMGGGVGGGMGGRRDGWMDGFAKIDNRFGYEKWLQGGSIGLALL